MVFIPFDKVMLAVTCPFEKLNAFIGEPFKVSKIPCAELMFVTFAAKVMTGFDTP
jgi:hypothetical protein